MRVFSTRAALVAFWLLVAGLALIPFGMITFFLFDPYDLGIVGYGGEYGQALSWFFLFVAFLVLGAFIVFCGYRIYRDLFREMPSAASMRAETEQGRSLSALCFGVGAIIGLYGFVDNGVPLVETLDMRLKYNQATAKLVSRDDKPALLNGKETVSGVYVFYTVDRTRIETDGVTPLKFSEPRVKRGSTFSVKYKKANPAEHEPGKITPISHYAPSVIVLIFLFWMISAGLTGCIENLKPERRHGGPSRQVKATREGPHKSKTLQKSTFGTRANR